nr:hypothetical protein MFLOJ_27690 [Mycobacterium florentinum]
MLEVGVGDGRQSARTPGVIDQDIDPAQFAGESLDGSIVCDVSHNCGAADLFREGIYPVRAPRHCDDVKPKSGKGFGGRFADPGTGTGHYRDPLMRII